MRTLWFLALNLFSAALIAQDPVMNLLRTSYITQREIEVDLGKENFVVHQSFLIGANQDKLFGSTLFNTTLYHYQRRKECYTNSLMVACQLPLYVKGDSPDKFNMLFGDLATSLNISSNLTGIASGLTTNYLKADDLAKILDNKISQFLRRINPKSVDGVKISPTNLQKLSKALKIIKKFGLKKI